MSTLIATPVPFLPGWQLLVHLVSLIHFTVVNFPILSQVATIGLNLPPIGALLHKRQLARRRCSDG